MRPRVRSTARTTAAAIAAVLALGANAWGQGQSVWWPLDSAPAGTPPTVLIQAPSSPQQTILDVTIHGFWYQTVMQQGQQFRRLSLDKTHGAALYAAIGRPELPALHHLIGDVVGGQVGPPAVQVVSEVTIPGAAIFPVQPADIEGVPSAPFAWDMAFYQMTTQPYPPTRGSSLGYRGRWSGLDLLAAESYPFRAIPATQSLIVTQRFIVTIAHPGTTSPTTQVITRRQAKQYELALANDTIVSAFRPVSLLGYAGDYLIITDPDFVEEIDPLADQKRRRGYAVTVATTDEAGTTCAAIKSYIEDWWSAGDPGRDHYVLLVGDTNTIPACVATAPPCFTAASTSESSDKAYACIDGVDDDGPDVYPEVRLGRFPCDTEAECTDMVTKTLNYEEGYPGSGSWLGEVVLACHRWADADYADQYKDAHEAVLAYPFSSPPTFTTEYGQDGATNATLDAELEAGVGVFAYRGHGGPSCYCGFGGWNNAGQSFTTTEVGNIDNGEKTPVVLSVACLNSDIANATDCIGEKWVKTTAGAAAHYGATGGTERDANDLLDLELFETIYEDNVVILGEALAGAELPMVLAHGQCGELNAWQYLLLGDPELEVWRQPPPPLYMVVAAEVPPGPGFITVTVTGGGLVAVPVPLAIVAVFKDGEFVDNRYTDANGVAQIPIDPETPGIIEVTAYTDFGPEGVARDTVLVVDPATAVPPQASNTRALALAAAEPNPFREQTTLAYSLPTSGPSSLRLFDSEGRCIRTFLDASDDAGQGSVAWDGRDSRGRRVSAGVYFVRLDHGRETRVGKVVLVR